MNPSNFYRRSDLSARSFYNSEESLSSENVSIPGSEYLPSEDENDHLSLDTSSDISSSETSSDDAAPIQQHPPTQGAPQPTPSQAQSLWDSDFDGRQQVSFSGSSTGLLRRITTQNPADIPIALFRQFFDDEIIDLMVSETNKYAEQFLASHQLRRSARMRRWIDVTTTEMENFFEIILATGSMQLPKMEDYWKKDDFYYHPMFHKLNITYNRFVLLQKNWHVADNQTAPTDDRLYKVADFAQKLISKFQAVYHPGKEVAVDETMISHRVRLLFRQYNPRKAHKYGIKLFKLCKMAGYIWNLSIYCGKGTGEIIDGLDHPGSLLVSLAAPLLNEGRLIVADNWYSSIPLAKYLQQRNIEYCIVEPCEKIDLDCHRN